MGTTTVPVVRAADAGILVVLTSAEDREAAERIATALVEERLAACVQLSDISSVYRWQGSVERDDEVRLLIKTSKARYAEVEARIVELHSYDLPAIVAIDATDALSSYADWVVESASASS